MAQVKEQTKAPKTELSHEETAKPIRCRVQNTGNQDAHRNGCNIEYGHKIEEEVKAMQSEIKKSVQRNQDLIQ